MTSLRDHAASTGGPEIVLTAELAGHTGRIAESTLTSADQISDDGEFPQHGVFLAVHEEDPTKPEGWDDEKTYWECPSALSQMIVDELDDDEEAIGLGVQITRTWGGGQEPWQIEGTVFDP